MCPQGHLGLVFAFMLCKVQSISAPSIRERSGEGMVPVRSTEPALQEAGTCCWFVSSDCDSPLWTGAAELDNTSEGQSRPTAHPLLAHSKVD